MFSSYFLQQFVVVFSTGLNDSKNLWRIIENGNELPLIPNQKQRSVPELNITLLRYFRYLLVESRHDGNIGVALRDFSAFRKICRSPQNIQFPKSSFVKMI